ncbi:hypothetical protein ABPG72_000144 [Tetrahymena utriculariae]
MEQQKKTMRALVLEEPKKPIVLKEIGIPTPKSGQLLIKVEAAPINPSDLAFLQGHYSSNKGYPCVPGFEGSGVVVSSGGGILGWSLVGKRVAIASQTQWGTYAEYCIADANSVLPLPDEVNFNQGACTFVNPLTVVAMLEVVKEAKVNAVVHSAAASALGKMMVRYFQDNGVQVINIVRREEQVEILKKEGAQHILDSSQAGFDEKLKALCASLNATIFFDAVAGELTGRVLKCMPNKSNVYVYGGLSLSGSVIDPSDLIFRKQTVTGFWLTEWIKTKNIVSLLFLFKKLKGLLLSQLKTDIQKEACLEEGIDAVKFYTSNMSKGKVIFKPQLKQEKQNE